MCLVEIYCHDGRTWSIIFTNFTISGIFDKIFGKISFGEWYLLTKSKKIRNLRKLSSQIIS